MGNPQGLATTTSPSWLDAQHDSPTRSAAKGHAQEPCSGLLVIPISSFTRALPLSDGGQLSRYACIRLSGNCRNHRGTTKADRYEVHGRSNAHAT